MPADQKTLIVYVKLQFLGPVIINLPSRKIIIWAVLIGMKKTLHYRENVKDTLVKSIKFLLKGEK